MRTDYYHAAGIPKATRIVPAVSAVLCNENNQVILQKRADNGLWALPGGTVEIGEDVATAILREIREETGLEARIDRLIGIYSDPHHVIAYSDGEVRQQFSICFECTIIGGHLTVSDESTDVRAFPVSGLDKLNIHPAIRQRLTDFLRKSATPFIR